MGDKIIKIIGVAASVAGVVASLINGWVSDKRQETLIAEKVAEAVAKATGKES